VEFIPATARRYAEAAFELALDRQELDRWAEDLRAVAEVVAEPRVLAFLDGARVPGGEKERLLEQALAGIGPLAWNLARLLLGRGRIGLAPQISAAFEERLNEHRGVTQAFVTTAVPLDVATQEAIATGLGELTGKQVIVEVEENPGIIGGLVARIGDRVIDGSTRARLSALKRELEGSAS
jgi:F-type H+-transporting ATPase subunit delta